MSKPAWRRSVLVLAMLATLLASASVLLGAPSSPFTYVHDDAGRLIAAVDPDGDTARYTYDAVGNLVSIDRVDSSVTRILEVTPKKGPVGSKVTIYGTGFSATPGSNTVTFNGTSATVTAATKSRLEVTVPLTATSGYIGLTGTGGSASTTSAFTVGPLAPAISGVSASVADYDDTLTISGSRFNTVPTRNNVTINGTFAEVTAASATSLTVKVPPAGVSSGPVAVETPMGRDVASSDLFIPPHTDLTPSQVGYTGRMSVGGSASITTPSAGKYGLVVFAGQKGQRIAARVSNSASAYTSMKLVGPDGLVVGPSQGVSVYWGGMLDTVVLPTTGTYTLQMSPSGNTGAASLALYEVAPDTLGEIDASGPAETITTTTPGQNHRLQFEGATGQRISLRTNAMSYPSGYGAYVSIKDPTGQNVVAPAFAPSPDGAFLDTLTLTETGTYTILVDPNDWGTGSADVRLYTVPGDVAATPTVGGSAVTLTTTAPGQNAVASFSATAGDRISAKLSSITFADLSWRLRLPDGSTLVGPQYGSSSSPAYLESGVLPQTGTYTLLVDPSGHATGSASLRIYSAADATGSISANGSEVTATLSSPGQNGVLSFSGTAGQRVSLTSSSDLSGDIYSYLQGKVELRDPSGAYVTETSLGPAFPRDFIDTVTLASTGTHTLRLDPSSDRTGTISVRLYDATNPTTSATVGGSAASVASTAPGQNPTITFSGTSGQRVSIVATGLGGSQSQVSIKAPSSATVLAPTYASGSPIFFEPVTLSETGTHTISIDPSGAWTGTVGMTLYDVPADATASLANPGSQSVTIGTPGQNGTLTFSGTNGEDLRIEATALSISEAYISVKKPDGSNLLGQSYLYTQGQAWNLPTLPTTGTYTILIDPLGSLTGAATIELDEQGQGGQSLQSIEPKGSAAVVAKNGPRSPEASTARAGDTGPRAGAPKASTPAPKKTKKRSRVRVMTPGVGRSQLLGQVRTTKGAPLAGVRVSIGRSKAVTNAKGRFRLMKIVPGKRTLIIDGTSRPGKARYGLFEAAVEIQPTRRTDLPFTIWLQKIDRARTMTLPAGILKKPFVLRTRAIPGLQLRIPKGAKVVDRHGRQVREMSITRIPVKRPPHPLPAGVRVPVYYSIQPALSRVVRADGRPAKARLIYPNYTYQRRGTRMDFWRYAGSAGWQIFGSGRVTKNRLVVPDKGVGISRLSGAMSSAGNRAPVAGQTAGGAKDGDPVDLATGLFGYSQSDLVLPDVLPISLSRVNNSGDGRVRGFGANTNNAYDLFLVNDVPYESAYLYSPDGSRVRYERISPGTAQETAVYEATATPGPLYKSRLSYRIGNTSYAEDGWDLRLRDGTELGFTGAALRTALSSIRDRFGNRVTIERETPQSASSIGRIRMIRSPNGRWIKPTYDSLDRITAARDNIGRTVSYAYGTGYALEEVTNAGGGTTTYAHDGQVRITSITDAREITFLTNTYDGAGRVATQTQADSTTYEFDYTLDGSGKVTATEVTDPRGIVRRVAFSALGYPTSDTSAHGTAEALTTSYTRASGSDLITRITDPLGRNSDFAYSAEGDITSVTRLAGTGGAVTTEMTYEPTYGLLASVTDPLDHTTAYAYTPAGALEEVTDPRSETTTIQSDEDGQPTLVTDPLDHETAIDYSAGATSAITDELGNVSSAFTDAAGRPVASTDATGRTTTSVYDALNRITSSANAAGEQTSFTHDANGNPTSLTDARSNATSYVYDAMDRVAEREDPLARSDTFTYDAKGNLATATDRGGRLTRFAYDLNDRQTSAGFDETPGSPPTYESTIDYSYDDAGRLVEADDSANGTITRTYDDLDRLTSEAAPSGTVSYGYDAANRRTSMDTAGQSQTTYAYDAADRLTGITRGSQNPTFAYDDANRLTSLALPGGVSMAYSYDDADRLTRILYSNGSGELGRIDYANDTAGRRQEASGSWARMDLPAAMTSGSFDDANRLTGRGTTSYSYDDTGSLVSDGTQSYAWNARGELTGLSGGAQSASFAYDALGRRREATIGSTTTSYRYDADNAVVETRGSSSVRILAGLGIDSALTRSEGSDTEALLADALGSTVALTDGSGVVQTEYSYDPFGTPSVSGTSSTNPTQFTGREWDGTGLQFSRARYYDPAMGRFISEDPIGFGGGDVNLYAYVANAPTRFTDPSGLTPWGDAYGWYQDNVAMPAMDFIVDDVHPVAYDWMPGYGFGYALGTRKSPAEIASQAASASPIGRVARAGQAAARAAKAGGRAGRPALAASDGGEIVGFTRHGVDRAIGDGAKRAGTRPDAILDAIKNPTKITEGVDHLGRPFKIYQGGRARVVINPRTGRIVSVNPRSGAGASR